MKDISIYFQGQLKAEEYTDEMLGNFIRLHTEGDFPEIDQKGVAFFYVPEFRNCEDSFGNEFVNDFRKPLYTLCKGGNWNHAIYDLGTILPGEQISDTFHAIDIVCQELIKKDVIPFVIGGSQDLTIAMYTAYEKLEQFVNLSTVDSRLDLGILDSDIRYDAWLNSILLKKPCYLFNYSNIGAQGHYIPDSVFKLFEELFFDICRLGQVSKSIQLAEPYIRNTDLLSMDLSSIRASDLQNNFYSSPNGLFANEACRIIRYAGMSDKLSSVGVFNYFSENHSVTDEMVAQLIWYFNEGYANRKGDFPVGSKKSYTKFRVFLEELDEEIVFYKSEKSSRWWIEVPYPSTTDSKYLRHQMVPCGFDTYKEAMKGDIPNLWWKTYQKMV